MNPMQVNEVPSWSLSCLWRGCGEWDMPSVIPLAPLTVHKVPPSANSSPAVLWGVGKLLDGMMLTLGHALLMPPMPVKPGWTLLVVSLPALYWLGAWWLQNPGQKQWFNPLYPLSDNGPSKTTLQET